MIYVEAGEVVRRVQVIGKSTYVVSLPKGWARRAGLQQGVPVSISLEPDGSLRILPPTFQKAKKPVIKLSVRGDTSKDSLVRELMARYLAGYKIIEISLPHNAVEYREIVRKIIANKMIGVELLEENEHTIVLQVLVNVEELPVNVVIQRMGQIAGGMISDSMEGLFSGDIKLLRDVVERDDFVDKLHLYLLRQLNASVRGFVGIKEIGLRSLEEAIEYAITGKSIERAADHAQKIATNAESLIEARISIKGLENELDLMTKLAKEVFTNSIRCFTSRDRARALSLLEEYPPKLVEVERRFISKILEEPCDARRHMVIRLIADSLRRVCDYSMDILEATVDLSLEGSTEA